MVSIREVSNPYLDTFSFADTLVRISNIGWLNGSSDHLTARQPVFTPYYLGLNLWQCNFKHFQDFAADGVSFPF